MLQEEKMFEFRSSSPSLSDPSSLVSGGLDDLENLELFPDLQLSNGVVSRQVSRESATKDPIELKKPKLIALKLDSQKEQELLEYITGVSDSEEIKPSVERVASLNSTPNTTFRTVTVNRPVLPRNGTELNVINVERYTTSYSDEYPEGKCMSKNAVAARENRQRKKQYVAELEQTLSSVKAENTTLKSQVSAMQETVSDLKTEVKYLRNVLANQSTLATLLKNIPSAPGVNLVSAVHGVAASPKGGEKKSGKRKRLREDDSDEENIDIQASDDESDIDAETCEVLSGRNNELMNGGSGVYTRRSQHIPVPHKQPDPVPHKQLDHCYSTNNPAVTQYQKRRQNKTARKSSNRSEDDDTTGGGAGVCLHVSGKKVSLEFCAQCSRRASGEERVS